MSRFLSGQLYVGIDRHMVGEQAGMFCLVICYAAQGTEVGRQEYEVYAAPLRHFYFPEAVERSFVTLFAARMLPGLQHGEALFLAEHHGIGFARRGAVEVARYDDGQPLGIFLEALLLFFRITHGMIRRQAAPQVLLPFTSGVSESQKVPDFTSSYFSFR